MFIIRSPDVNLETKDGWTPLQLSIYKNNYSGIFHLLLIILNHY